MYGPLTGRAAAGWFMAIALSTLLGMLFAGEIDTSENGPLERLQVGVLSAGTFLFTWLAVCLARSEPASRLHHPIFAAAIALGTILVIGREISWFRIYGLERDWADPIKYSSWAACIGAFVVIASRGCRGMRVLAETKLFLWRTGPYLAAMAALLGIGDLYEKHLLPTEHSQHYEELFELLGYLTLLYAGVLSRASMFAPAHPEIGAAGIR